MKTEKACGAIILKNQKVLLIQQVDGNWGFPKGHVENNETEEETAIREVKEETHIDIKVDTSKRYQIEYTLPNGNMKIAVFFVAQPTSEEIIAQEEEILNIEWLDIEKAEDRLTFANTKELFRKVMKELNQYN